jgi:hypothetical protein
MHPTAHIYKHPAGPAPNPPRTDALGRTSQKASALRPRAPRAPPALPSLSGARRLLMSIIYRKRQPLSGARRLQPPARPCKLSCALAPPGRACARALRPRLRPTPPCPAPLSPRGPAWAGSVAERRCGAPQDASLTPLALSLAPPCSHPHPRPPALRHRAPCLAPATDCPVPCATPLGARACKYYMRPYIGAPLPAIEAALPRCGRHPKPPARLLKALAPRWRAALRAPAPRASAPPRAAPRRAVARGRPPAPPPSSQPASLPPGAKQAGAHLGPSHATLREICGRPPVHTHAPAVRAACCLAPRLALCSARPRKHPHVHKQRPVLQALYIHAWDRE